MTLVVIDDNPGDLRLIREAVARADPSMDVISFTDGPEAIDALCGSHATIQPGAILLDLRLGAADGLDVLRIIRFVPRLADIPVIVFTSSNAAADRHRSHLLGATRFLRKPLEAEDYFRAVDDVVQQIRRGPESKRGRGSEE
ncbi:MAG TPA: response regulator [Bryobacteraceae bacterium]|jgi:CheY-like chemotaxis protein|nr:response regulator [Bryobacteraceae bacterium]